MWVYIASYNKKDAKVAKKTLNQHGINVSAVEQYDGVVDIHVGESRVDEACEILNNISDTDRDGVPDSRDCEPFNPNKQGKPHKEPTDEQRRACYATEGFKRPVDPSKDTGKE